MNFLQSRFYGQLIQFSDFIFLSILWVICLLPIFTIVPATISLFAVVRAWKSGTSEGIFSLYFSEFKHLFFKKVCMSLCLIVFTTVVIVDLKMIMPIENPTSSFLFLLLSAGFFLVISAFVHYFNLFVRSADKHILVICKNTLILVVSQFHWTLLGVLVLCFVSLLVLFLPMLIFVIGSLTAYLLIQISDKAVKNMQVKQQLIEKRELC